MNKLKSIKRIMSSEFVTKFSVMNILILIGVNLVAGIPSFFTKHLGGSDVIDPKSGVDIVDHIGRAMAQILGSVGTYLLLISLFVSYRDKSALDKNRAAYLNYSKYEVALSKLLADICLFTLGLIFGIIMTTVTISIKIDQSFTNVHIVKLISWFIGIIFLYSLTMIGFKLILSAKLEKLKTGILISVWIILTIGIFLVLGIVSILVDDVHSFVINNKWVIASVPVLNFMMPTLLLSKDFSWEYLLPMIFEVILFIGGMWKITADKLKLYFCV